MNDSRPSSPEAPPQDLWSSILDSVSSSRSIPAKQILLLGEPSSGKSTLASALLHKAAAEEVQEDQKLDFALGYDWADVKDDADEDTLARLSVYTVPSSAASYTALLPHFLPPRTSLPHTVVVITLDWTKPWTFIDQLYTWLSWIEAWVQGDGSRELQIVREENRERLQAHLQRYTEPSAEPLPATSSLSETTLLPLGPGTLTHNTAGVPIIVACTKADHIDDTSDGLGPGASGMGGMVKGKGGEWEERTDTVMQVLRTICLKHGAALFYTTPLPQTLQVLRQYALHLLFMPPAPSPGLSTEAVAPVRNPFPFLHKANTLDRDRIVVPAGWDSWGKIAVLREGFDAKAWGEAWENDIEQTEGEPEQAGARKQYSSLVPDQGPKPTPLPPFNNPTPEQVFLAKNYDENSKKADRDPRASFRNPTENPSAGIVGPMGSSSFNLPNVERALTEMEGAHKAPGVLSDTIILADPYVWGSNATRGPAKLLPEFVELERQGDRSDSYIAINVRVEVRDGRRADFSGPSEQRGQWRWGRSRGRIAVVSLSTD
ncbi:dynein 1 light intermediate chain [Phanerochaete sordida]|uniref:Dynein 1 light intermediate chain n=1 Tax=Phanerochaete sordida TaxID=48140 RepID=A0A9P3FWW3_9APHY|nr:dynein 1 light intermediate chain [Phanerochaete sordida]